MRLSASLAERSTFVDVPIIATPWPPRQPEVGRVMGLSLQHPLSRSTGLVHKNRHQRAAHRKTDPQKSKTKKTKSVFPPPSTKIQLVFWTMS